MPLYPRAEVRVGTVKLVRIHRELLQTTLLTVPDPLFEQEASAHALLKKKDPRRCEPMSGLFVALAKV